MKTVYKLSPESKRQLEEIDRQIARLIEMKVDIYARSQLVVLLRKDNEEDRRLIEKTVHEQSFLSNQKILDSLRIANLVFEDPKSK